MATKHSTRTERIDTSEVQGDGSYIVIRRPTIGEGKKNKKLVVTAQRKVDRAERRYNRLVDNDDGSGDYDERIDNAADNLDALEDEADNKANTLLCQYIVEWNWKDDDGKRLPIPKDDVTAMDMINQPEMQFIVDQFNVSDDTKKN